MGSGGIDIDSDHWLIQVQTLMVSVKASRLSKVDYGVLTILKG